MGGQGGSQQGGYDDGGYGDQGRWQQAAASLRQRPLPVQRHAAPC